MINRQKPLGKTSTISSKTFGRFVYVYNNIYLYIRVYGDGRLAGTNVYNIIMIHDVKQKQWFKTLYIYI